MSDKPIGTIWRPVRDLAPEHRDLSDDGARQAAAEWREIRKQLELPGTDRSAMDIWLREQKRAFAIETGQIEGLYLLRHGVMDTLMTEGFEDVRGSYSHGGIGDETLRGLLQDQEASLEMVIAHARDGRPLTASAIKEWHALLTRHQDSATGIDPRGKRVEIPLRKGEWKIRPNNPRRVDGHLHEYCPPEQVEAEMERFLAFHEGHAGLNFAPETEAAWLHHEFVRIHPFQDGNGRVSRLLVAYAYAKAGEFPPLVPASEKDGYINALELADLGNFPAFVRYLGWQASDRCRSASMCAKLILLGRTEYCHGNGGVTVRGIYHPPDERLLPQAVAERPETPETLAQQRADRELQLACALTARGRPSARPPWDVRTAVAGLIDAVDRAEDPPDAEIEERAKAIARARVEADLRVEVTSSLAGSPRHEHCARFEGNPRFRREERVQAYDRGIKEWLDVLDQQEMPPNDLERFVARALLVAAGTGEEALARELETALGLGTVPTATEIRTGQRALITQLSRPMDIERLPMQERDRLEERVYSSFTADDIRRACEGRGPFLDALECPDDRATAAANLKALHADEHPGPAPWHKLHAAVVQAVQSGRRQSEKPNGVSQGLRLRPAGRATA